MSFNAFLAQKFITSCTGFLALNFWICELNPRIEIIIKLLHFRKVFCTCKFSLASVNARWITRSRNFETVWWLFLLLTPLLPFSIPHTLLLLFFLHPSWCLWAQPPEKFTCSVIVAHWWVFEHFGEHCNVRYRPSTAVFRWILFLSFGYRAIYALNGVCVEKYQKTSFHGLLRGNIYSIQHN